MSTRCLWRLGVLCAWGAAGMQAAAQGAPGGALPDAAHTQAQAAQDESLWLTVSERTLERMRGGFDFGSGLSVSFGISRAVYINDQLVTTTAFQLPRVEQLTAAQAAMLGQQLARLPVQVVQNGPGNSIDLSALNVPFATYVQNTLSDQTIRTETVIQATSSGMSMLKSLNLQALIQDGMASAIVNR